MAHEKAPPAGWVRDHLANERTLLAWVRTSVAFMAFGVALAKLGILLSVAVADHPELSARFPSALRSQLVGSALILFGGAIAVIGVVKSRRWSRRINPDYEPPTQRTLSIVAGLTAAAAIGLVAYVLV
jgi:putative membrane protein